MTVCNKRKKLPIYAITQLKMKNSIVISKTKTIPQTLHLV